MFVTSNQEHIVVPWQADLASVMPHAREMKYQGMRMLLIPNRHDEAKIARNLGIPVPAPILTRYDWRGLKPWAVQRTTSALLTESPRAYILNEFGTGKSRAVIWAADYLRQSARAGRVLVAAPLSTLTPVWEAELFRVLPKTRVRVLHGSREERLRRLDDDADYYIINHHGLSLLRDQLLKKGFDIVVLDELAVFRNHSTGLWKAANAFARDPSVKYCWGLTGSPTPKAPTDAWAQVRLLTPDRVTRSLVRFKDQTMRQITSFKWVKRPNAMDVVHNAMQPSVRFALSDVMELPDITYRTQNIILEPQARQAYQLMFERMRIKTNNGETITAVNEGVLQSKLLQVACGFIYTDNKGTFQLPIQPRLDAVIDIAASTNRKFIIFVPFIHALEGVAAALQAAGEQVSVVHGQTPVGQRNKIFRAFQDDPSGPRGIVAHPACMSHGLNLTAANTIVWYAPTNNFETYEQANARVRRPGQKDKTLIVHLVGTPVERVMYARLRDRASFQGMLLELFHQQELEF